MFFENFKILFLVNLENQAGFRGRRSRCGCAVIGVFRQALGALTAFEGCCEKQYRLWTNMCLRLKINWSGRWARAPCPSRRWTVSWSEIPNPPYSWSRPSVFKLFHREQGSSVRVLPERGLFSRQPLSVSAHARRAYSGVQTLDATLVQEGRRVRVSSRVRNVQDAHLLLLPTFWWV